METIRDETKVAILKFVYENPGSGFNAIARALKQKGAKATITKKRNELEIKGLLRRKKGERKGQKSKHYITSKGAHLLKQTPKALSTTKGLLSIGFSQAFLNSLGEEQASRFLALMKDPEQSKRIASLVAGQINLYAENISKPTWAAEYIEPLKRHFFVGSLPPEISTLINQAIEFNVFSDTQEAFAFFFNHGVELFKSMLRGELSKVPDKAFIVCVAVKYDSQNAQYVSASKEAKEKAITIPPEKLKELWLRIW